MNLWEDQLRVAVVASTCYRLRYGCRTSLHFSRSFPPLFFSKLGKESCEVESCLVSMHFCRNLQTHIHTHATLRTSNKKLFLAAQKRFYESLSLKKVFKKAYSCWVYFKWPQYTVFLALSVVLLGMCQIISTAGYQWNVSKIRTFLISSS